MYQSEPNFLVFAASVVSTMAIKGKALSNKAWLTLQRRSSLCTGHLLARSRKRRKLSSTAGAMATLQSGIAIWALCSLPALVSSKHVESS
uniref:Secreted protein n=1 Tax=Romanomermis culicivorax TaxID=13658 RepID=A0A915IWJ7_ROMCU